MLNIKFSLSII